MPPGLLPAPLVALLLVVAVVADSFVEIPLPLLELDGKTWIYSCLPRDFLILVLVMGRRNPSSFYLWMFYAHPLSFSIVISFALRSSEDPLRRRSDLEPLRDRDLRRLERSCLREREPLDEGDLRSSSEVSEEEES